MTDWREQFLLDPEVTFLNHGSFGATPRPLLDVFQAWQRRLERQPVLFLGRELAGLLAESRAALAAHVNVRRDDLVFVPNATYGVNIVARSLDLGPDDELLTTDHEYGACERMLDFIGEKRGVRIVKQPIPLPVPDDEGLVDLLWQGVTPRTKAIFISHITSSTATILPMAAICARARAEGILTIVDGAHTLGQIPLDLAAIDPDFYASNAHKWLCAPKGAAFLYVRPDKQALIEPLVVSWGWGPERTYKTGSDLVDYVEWQGTNDFAAFLTVPAALDYQVAHDWPALRTRCHDLLADALPRLDAITGQASLYRSENAYAQMAVAALPDSVDPLALKDQLYDRHRLELPVYVWQNQNMMRISVQAYNTVFDLNRLADALASAL